MGRAALRAAHDAAAARAHQNLTQALAAPASAAAAAAAHQPVLCAAPVAPPAAASGSAPAAGSATAASASVVAPRKATTLHGQFCKTATGWVAKEMQAGWHRATGWLPSGYRLHDDLRRQLLAPLSQRTGAALSATPPV